jgi:RimJ/RimL family protein N-acetyltransferase
MKTTRTILTPLSTSDFEEIMKMYEDPDCFKFIRPQQGLTRPEYEAFLKKKLANNDPVVGFWTVRSIETGEFIGNANLYPFPGKDLEHLGALFQKKFWNQGYATEVLTELVKHAATKGLKEVYGVVEEGNKTSERLMEKLGFSLDFEEEEDDCLLRFFKREIEPA